MQTDHAYKPHISQNMMNKAKIFFSMTKEDFLFWSQCDIKCNHKHNVHQATTNAISSLETLTFYLLLSGWIYFGETTKATKMFF